MTRKQFLTYFLGALGARQVLFSDVQTDTIGGSVVYDLGNPAERQDFRWHASESDVPAADVCRLAELIHKRHLLEIDKLIVTRDDLRHLYNQNEAAPLSPEEFDQVLNTLEDVRVSMVDDGDEIDTYFIHE